MQSKKKKKIFLIHHVRDWYARFERPISSLSLVGGFIFDAVTLKRVDMFWENVWVVVHLLIVALCIILINRGENKGIDAKDPARIHFWFVNILQFTFGGLLSTFLVFYFRSATLEVSWPFFLILIAAFIGNESLKGHFTRLSFQISFFFLCLFSFAIFLVPVVFHRIGPLMFILSGLLSLVLLWLFLATLKYFAKEKFYKSKGRLIFSIALIYILLNALYFFHLIPPIPLSLKDSGIYYQVVKNPDGNYAVSYESRKWWDFFDLYETVHAAPETTLYAWSAVFSPTFLNTDIIHEWQRYDETAKEWKTEGRIDLALTGGREGGYRTYSTMSGLSPGLWRVNVQTPFGEVLGRIRFRVLSGDPGSELQTLIKG